MSLAANYVTNNRFYVEMESTITANFSECGGLGVTLSYEAIEEGGVNDQQRILIGAPKFSEVILKRGVTDNLTFWQWIQSILQSQTNQRRNLNILTFNQAGETMQCWTLIGATPISWKAPMMQADGEAAAIEELHIAYEGLKVENNAGGGGAQMPISRAGASNYYPGSS
ncbi:MAG: phage tail protein [Cyanobacteria bacterium P01_F01_bin.86]